MCFHRPDYIFGRDQERHSEAAGVIEQRLGDLKMKKLMTLLLCTILLISLAGCGGNSNKEEPAKEEIKETEAVTELENTDILEIDDSMVERTVGEAFRFLVPKDWNEQTDGSYEIETDRGPMYIVFFKFPVKGDGYALPDGFSLDSDDFGEKFTDYLNQMHLLAEGSLELYNTGDKAYETEKGLRYRSITCSALDSNGSKNNHLLFYLYEWTDEAYFCVAFDWAYSISSVRECINTINQTIERID